MIEWFAEDARLALVAARHAALGSGAREVDTRHLAIGLIRASEPAQDGLRAAGTDPVRVVKWIAFCLRGDLADSDRLGSIPPTPAEWLEETRRPEAGSAVAEDAVRASELALQETIRLGAKVRITKARVLVDGAPPVIDGGKLLLGILGADCPGRAALISAGVDLAALRTALETPAG